MKKIIVDTIEALALIGMLVSGGCGLIFMVYDSHAELTMQNIARAIFYATILSLSWLDMRPAKKS